MLESLFFYSKLRKFILTQQIQFDIKTKPVIFDVGANRGQSATFFRRLFPSAKIYCFEPSPSVFKILQKTAGENTLLINKGVGEVESNLTFFESHFSESSTFIRPNQSSTWQARKEKILGIKSEDMYVETYVPVITIDNFLSYEKVDFIYWLKIDVEGFELKVLLGAINSLKQHRIQYVQLESHFDDMRLDESQEISKILTGNGYFRIKRIKHPFGNFYEDIYRLNQLKPRDS